MQGGGGHAGNEQVSAGKGVEGSGKRVCVCVSRSRSAPRAERGASGCNPKSPAGAGRRTWGTETQRPIKYMKGCARFRSVCRPERGAEARQRQGGHHQPRSLPRRAAICLCCGPEPARCGAGAGAGARAGRGSLSPEENGPRSAAVGEPSCGSG